MLELAVLFCLLAGPGSGPGDVAATGGQAPQDGGIRYVVRASAPRLNRKLVGPPSRYVQGVPAEPVNSFVYDGDGSVKISGELTLEVEPSRNTGTLRATWRDTHGEWVYEQTRFVHPEHASGVRLGSTVDRVDSVINEGIAVNVYLHGDTTAGMPVLPTVFTHLASWGPAKVTLNGVHFRNPYELPAPDWIGHLMVTEGVRREDGTVRDLAGDIYSPQDQRQGAVEEGDLEVHLTFHDEKLPMTSNFPPIFSFFYHLVFEEVSIEILQADEPPRRPAQRPVRPDTRPDPDRPR